MLVCACQGKQAEPSQAQALTEKRETTVEPAAPAADWSKKADPTFAPGPGDRPRPATDWAQERLLGRVETVVVTRELPNGDSSSETLKFNRFGQRVREGAELDDEGRVRRFSMGPQTTENLEFDEQGRVTRYRETLAHHRGGASKVTEYRSTYDDAGRLTRQERHVGSAIDTTTFEYDEDGDLVAKHFNAKSTRWRTEFDGPRKRLTQLPGEHMVEIIDRKSGRLLSTERNGSISAWTYLEIDDHGNWTAREFAKEGKSSRQSREITYFDDEAFE